MTAACCEGVWLGWLAAVTGLSREKAGLSKLGFSRESALSIGNSLCKASENRKLGESTKQTEAGVAGAQGRRGLPMAQGWGCITQDLWGQLGF